MSLIARTLRRFPLAAAVSGLIILVWSAEPGLAKTKQECADEHDKCTNWCSDNVAKGYKSIICQDSCDRDYLSCTKEAEKKELPPKTAPKTKVPPKLKPGGAEQPPGATPKVQKLPPGSIQQTE